VKESAPLFPDDRLSPIRPEAVAKKLAAVRNREKPDLLNQIDQRPVLVELLWFIQAMSLQPGGLLSFCEDMLKSIPGRLGTPMMRSVAAKSFSQPQKEIIWTELPNHLRPVVALKTRYAVEREDYTAEEWQEMEANDKKALASAAKTLTADHLYGICRKEALTTIPVYLAALCTNLGVGFDYPESIETESEDLEASASVVPLRIRVMAWRRVFDDVIAAVQEMMALQAATARKRIAMTAVASRVFQEWEYAHQESVMVRIEGGSGFGKTEALEACCDMRLGISRSVRIPPGNSMADFLKAIGKAYGIDCSYGSQVLSLAEKVDYIIEHGGPFLVLDECAFLFPRSYSSTTAPARLEWVRAKILDRGLPLVLSSTPAKWNGDLARFVKTTGYTLEEFLGRNFLTVRLPESLSERDMIEVARIHFPELDRDALGYIATEAKLSENYLRAVEAVSKRARFIASRSKGRITLKVIDAALADVLPGRSPDPAQKASPLQHPLKSFSRAVNPEAPDQFPLRSLQPSRADQVADSLDPAET
jgi:hypothetical protein